MNERDLSILISDPDIERAFAIFSNAKKEASSLVSGDDEESVMRRNQLQSALIRELIERSGLNKQNGQSKTNTEMLAAAEAAL